MSCLLCTALSSTGDLVFENEHAAVVLHEDWSPRGHAMVVSKRHVENASDASPEFFAVWQVVERVILRETACERAMILKLGIAAPHLHIHIYPMPATATRADVFAAFDGHARTDRDESFVARVRAALDTALAAE